MVKPKKKTKWRALALDEVAQKSDEISISKSAAFHRTDWKLNENENPSNGFVHKPNKKSLYCKSFNGNDRNILNLKQESQQTKKVQFNEDEYTKISTPRQDVLFKKGYLSRPRPSTPLTTTNGNHLDNVSSRHPSSPKNELSLQCDEHEALFYPSTTSPALLPTSGSFYGGQPFYYMPFTPDLRYTAQSEPPLIAVPSFLPPFVQEYEQNDENSSFFMTSTNVSSDGDVDDKTQEKLAPITSESQADGVPDVEENQPQPYFTPVYYVNFDCVPCYSYPNNFEDDNFVLSEKVNGNEVEDNANDDVDVSTLNGIVELPQISKLNAEVEEFIPKKSIKDVLKVSAEITSTVDTKYGDEKKGKQKDQNLLKKRANIEDKKFIRESTKQIELQNIDLKRCGMDEKVKGEQRNSSSTEWVVQKGKCVPVFCNSLVHEKPETKYLSSKSTDFVASRQSSPIKEQISNQKYHQRNSKGTIHKKKKNLKTKSKNEGFVIEEPHFKDVGKHKVIGLEKEEPNDVLKNNLYSHLNGAEKPKESVYLNGNHPEQIENLSDNGEFSLSSLDSDESSPSEVELLSKNFKEVNVMNGLKIDCDVVRVNSPRSVKETEDSTVLECFEALQEQGLLKDIAAAEEELEIEKPSDQHFEKCRIHEEYQSFRCCLEQTKLVEPAKLPHNKINLSIENRSEIDFANTNSELNLTLDQSLHQDLMSDEDALLKTPKSLDEKSYLGDANPLEKLERLVAESNEALHEPLSADCPPTSPEKLQIFATVCDWLQKFDSAELQSMFTMPLNNVEFMRKLQYYSELSSHFENSNSGFILENKKLFYEKYSMTAASSEESLYSNSYTILESDTGALRRIFSCRIM